MCPSVHYMHSLVGSEQCWSGALLNRSWATFELCCTMLARFEQGRVCQFPPLSVQSIQIGRQFEMQFHPNRKSPSGHNGKRFLVAMMVLVALMMLVAPF